MSDIKLTESDRHLFLEVSGNIDSDETAKFSIIIYNFKN